MDAIEIRNVTKIYKKGIKATKVIAVENLSFSVKKGLVTGFVGPNGAGKTTTIKMIMGLVFPTKGEIYLHGKNSIFPKAREKVAFLSEQPYFYPHLSVREMLEFTAKLLKISDKKIPEEIERVLKTVELSHKIEAKIRELSKGMQQRLNMALALLGDPETFILDEPMSGMDPPGRRLFREIMKELKLKGKTLFFSTHVLDDIESVCDEVVVLKDGKLNFCGKVTSLLEEGFIGTEIVIDCFDSELINSLSSAGLNINTDRKESEGIIKIFVPRTANVETLKSILREKKIFPLSITRCSKTLEELLYGKREDSK
ncbi:MAG: ABC transporter ATP-binding protein [Chitinispirillaceae bacterium]|nr:ABC transporter ATP-binding protein [Chitinispirillaceae bacterium]